MLRELVELGRYRLDRGWTYRKLAAEINRACKARKSAFHISHSRLYSLLNDPNGQPNELTLHGLRVFLEAQERVAS